MQADFSPSLLQGRVDEIKSHFKVSSCTSAADIAKEASIHEKDLVNAVAMYEEWMDLLGPPEAPVNLEDVPYVSHIRHLRRVYRNAQDAVSVADCRVMQNDLVLRGISQRELATECFYLFRCCLLGHFKPEVYAESEAAFKCMPLMKAEFIREFSGHFLSREEPSSRKSRHVLGLQQDPRSSHDAETDFTEEWQSSVALIESNFQYILRGQS